MSKGWDGSIRGCIDTVFNTPGFLARDTVDPGLWDTYIAENL